MLMLLLVLSLWRELLNINYDLGFVRLPELR